ncbi:MAG TPA: hypothetical protein VEK36_01420 [Candidatus Paceibacterota bacterium]|nr:hypothetical protein [Candidatus Paceibacterota bacterium]
MTKGLAFFVLLAGIVYLGFSWERIFNSHSDPAQIENPSSDSVQVQINETGFIPEEIEISKGTQVVFKNTGSRPHWPASNFHPTHTLYPEGGGCIGSKLDACRGLAPGETFAFTFNIPGTWPMHDHLSPGLTAIIKVTGEPASKNSKPNPFIQFFKNLFQKRDANAAFIPSEDFKNLSYSEQLAKIKEYSKIDGSKAWDYLKQTFFVNDQVIGNVHEFAHIIGNVIYKQQGLKGIAVCDNTFAFGCYHGVTEELLKEKGTAVITEVEKECLVIFPPEKSQNYTGCIHGMGHGLLSWFAYDIPKALKACDVLQNQYRNYCYDGVFMENAGEGTGTDRFSKDDPWQFCRGLDSQYQYNCARYQSEIFLSQFKTIDKIGEACGKGPTPIMIKICFESIGYFAAQRAQGQPDSIRQSCAMIANEPGENTCLIGAARETIFQAYANWQNVSSQLCSELAGSWQQECIKSNLDTARSYQRL